MKQRIALIVIIVLTLACASSTPAAAPTAIPPTVVPPTSTPEFAELNLTFVNHSGVPMDYFWVNENSKEESYGTIEPGASRDTTTYSGQTWRIRNKSGALVQEYQVTDDAQQTVTIEADVADPIVDALMAQAKKFDEEGRIPATDGDIFTFNDFSETLAQIGYYVPYPFNDADNNPLEFENFVFNGHLKWSTATETSDTSGCGILFAGQPDGSNYTVFLDKTRVFFSSSSATLNLELGKTSGTGKVSFGNPAEADLSLIVYQTHAYVYVDGKFIGEYSLSSSKPLKGQFGYVVVSGTNKDYGTRCEVTKAAALSLK